MCGHLLCALRYFHIRYVEAPRQQSKLLANYAAMDLPDHLGSGKVSVLKPTNKNYHQDSYQEVPTEQCGPDCDSRVPANWALLGAQVTWLVSYTITNCSAYSIAITRSTSVFEGHGPSKRSRKLALQSQDPDGIRGSVACQTLILGSSLIGLVTVIVSYISQLVTRHVCVFLPYISDSFVYPPGDWFSRWGLMIFSEGLAFYCYCVYLSDRLSNVLGKVSLLLIGFVSAFNMSLVAIINEVHARIVGRAWFRLQ
mmetsp:Transcript_2166/g.7688  ORF Transcript_2166/g.7688 Transcript_2166/m.7688 type:complete len:254 (-) Transcript_2166:2266-3027(-)